MSFMGSVGGAMNEVAEFEAWARTYDDNALQPAYRTIHREVVNRVARQGQHRRLLDLGCGTGQLLELAAQVLPTWQLVGLDLSGGMLVRARGRGASRHSLLVRARVQELPFTAEAFDVVTCTATVRHWWRPADAIAELGRVLRPSGLLYCADFWPIRHRAWCGLSPAVAGQLPRWLASAMSQAALRVRSVEVVGGYGLISHAVVVTARKAS